MKIVKVGLPFCLACFMVAAIGQSNPPRARAGALASLTEQLKQHHVELTRVGLLKALRSPDDQARYLAALRLAEEKDVNSVPAIEEALAVEKIPETRINIAIALVQLGQERGVLELTADCEDPKLPGYFRARAMMYLLPLGNEPCFRSALDLVHSDPDSRPQVLAFLSRYRSSSKKESEEILETIIQCLGDESAAVRIQSSFALRTLANPAAIPALQHAIAAEQDDTVRSEMQDSLRYLKTKQRE